MDRAELARRLGAATGAGASVGSKPAVSTVEARDPAQFQAEFAAAVAAGGNVFLADPSWGPAERAQFQALIAQSDERPVAAAARGWLCIPTGGSSGRMKLARHDEQTIAAAVRGFCAHFAVERVDAVGLLPLHHVSGLMAWLRCALTGGTYRPWDGRLVAQGELPPSVSAEGSSFVSVVPTQLARWIEQPAMIAWLRGFRAVFVGGGPAWPELIEAGARLRLPLSFSYGMTETAAMVAALRPAEFLAGLRGCGSALPHARVSVDATGTIAIGGESLFRGYYPAFAPRAEWSPQDLGRIDDQGSLHVLGRSDGLIISGGEKVDPLEVESALRATGLLNDVVVLGVPDAHWGEAVVAFYPVTERTVDSAILDRAVAERLALFKRPKRYVPVADWPRNEQGKVNRSVLRAAAGRASR